MTCLPSLNGCNHNKSVSLVETQRSGGKVVSFISAYFTPTCLFKVLLADAERPGSSRLVIGMWGTDRKIPSGNCTI